jgi:hypothetical protein
MHDQAVARSFGLYRNALMLCLGIEGEKRKRPLKEAATKAKLASGHPCYIKRTGGWRKLPAFFQSRVKLRLQQSVHFSPVIDL